MIVASVLTFARNIAQTDSNGLTDGVGLSFANEANQDFHRKLIEKGVDASQVQETSILGVVNQGIYPYPTKPASVLALKTIELNYADTQPTNYQPADQVDVSNLPAGVSMGWLRTNANPYTPQFDDRGNSFEIFPTPTSAHNVTGLIKMFYFAQPSVYAAISDTVRYPEEIDPAILGFRTAANFMTSLGKHDEAMVLNAKYEERVNQYISTFSRGSQKPIQATPLQISGWEF